MCMKYLNTNIQCFDNSVSQYWLSNGALSSFIGNVGCSKEGADGYKVDKFGIVMFINIRGSASDQAHNPLAQKKKIDFKIRLTRLSKVPEEQLSYDLTDFVIDLSDESLIRKACFDYVDLIKVINVDNLIVKSTGEYVIKVLVRKVGEELYNIQMVHRLSVDAPK